VEQEGTKEPTIVIVVFQIMTIVGESSQKLSKIGETFSSGCGVYCQNSHYCGHGMMVCLGPMSGYGRHR
jgi:hypothetical protein